MRKVCWLTAIFLVATGCDTSSSVINLVADSTDSRTVNGDHLELPESDVPAPDTMAPDLAPELMVFDLADSLPFVECEPGTGCFLEPCEENGDCQSSYCAEHLGAAVCTQACQDECAPGWSCQKVAGTEPDIVFICVSDHANLCKPCAVGADCKSIGGADDVCVAYGAGGSFCGGSCQADGDCPWGFSCADSSTVDGIETKQCVADTGDCPCTGSSIKLSLSTPCQVENASGICHGLRVCTADGLSPCDAATPSEESCNGLDDDCDGDVDEPRLEGGVFIQLCDDGNECTDDFCDGETGCSHSAVAGGECKDGDPCTVGDHCAEETCVGSPVLCDDSDPCTDDSCDGLGGCSFSHNSAACDDNDPCTLGDSCQDGVCAGEAIDCECQSDEDCAFFEDGDLCNGSLYCKMDSIPYLCKLVPDSIVTCPEPAEGPDSICQQSTCDPSTGECGITPHHEGFACSDGNACTLGDTCADGACISLSALQCNDNNECTEDICDAAAGCIYAPTAGACDDGLPCTLDDQCVGGKCVSSTPLDCDDGNACTVDKCGEDGCYYIDSLGACDDGNACTLNDKCVAGICESGIMLSCNDANPCTLDTCSDLGSCVHIPVAGECDDGNACTVGDACAEGLCGHAGLTDCDDDNDCTFDTCDPLTGCVHLTTDVPCNDGDLCTTNDHCHLGACIGGGDLPCNDSNPCTDDSCEAEAGCLFVPNSAPCDDGSKCSLADQCKSGWCMPGLPPDCDDGELCTTDSCDPDVGCVNSNNEVPCDDGNACTQGDACAGGICTGGAPPDCNDNNPCTDDSCQSETGCVHLNNTASCEDGDLCTLDDHCNAGACVPGEAKPICNDDNACTDDACVPEFGCIYINNLAACDDGNACTTPDTCANGSCAAGAPVVCPDDANTCTTESCDVEQGCQSTPIPDCCGNGVKEGEELCDDGNQQDGDGCSADCKSNGIFAFGEWRPEMKCGDFQNLGPSYLKFCFTLKGQTLCTGQHDNGNAQCFDEAGGVRFLYDWNATWPMRFTKGTQDCLNYHPTYLKNFANAIGYANFQVMQQKSGNGCPRTYIDDNGMFKQIGQDGSAQLPYEIKYWN